MANDAESLAQAVYPKPFSRPPSMGETYNTWKDAKGPDVGQTSVELNRLPSRVDNSTRPEFPPIYKQNGGACGQFTAIASIFTYEMNLLNGTHADTDAKRFPADFSWNMVNRASNKNGSEAYHGWETAKHIGIPTVKTYGTVHRKEAGPWPNGYEIWTDEWAKKKISPQPLNGWPLFGNRKNNVGEVPLAGPGDDTPLEIGIDLTPLFKQMELNHNPDARLFLNFSNGNKSDAIGTLHTCAIRSYDNHGKFIRESTVEIPDGNFDKTPLLIETSLH
jgi:hypothetical protein